MTSRAPHVAVVGAGAFGGWTALSLLRRGARVTLVDARGPGNASASSGDETRVLRGLYGPDRLYVQWVVRALEIFRASGRLWGERLYQPTGALWLFSVDDAYARTSLPLLAEAGLPVAALMPAEAARRFPQIDLTGVLSIYFEEQAGILFAARTCQAVKRAFAAEGGDYRELAALPGEVRDGAMASVALQDGSALGADAFVFACGPWLGELFPDVLGSRVRPTRQEVFYFDVPAESGLHDESFPVWLDFGERITYGIPGDGRRGFKVADDTRGEPFDPTHGDRTPTAEALARAREVLARRFPSVAQAPLLSGRVCQYENSPDGQLIVDRHPEAGNAWLVGGGSGHGFKLGPALGEHVASLVLGTASPHPELSLSRFARATPERTQFAAGQADR
ncbi:MAG TPA: FAD-dependent oxidoreductase [Thermoanaerobaculia bacterium]